MTQSIALYLPRPEPHPLDFDWRFSPDTAKRLATLVENKSCLAVGTPTVATQLFGVSPVSLVDRHPIQTVRPHICIDPGNEDPLKGDFSVSVLDPPWYPRTFQRWMSWAANSVGHGGLILASIWPSETRPSAEAERAELFAWISEWGSHSIEQGVLFYETPTFELEALQTVDVRKERAPRSGDLLIVQVRKIPDLPHPITALTTWARFIFDDYQLALKITKDNVPEPSIAPHPGAANWIWPSVSLRAAGRDSIDLWSSHNEVAVVHGSEHVLSALRKLAHQIAPSIDDPVLHTLFQTFKWKIPQPPYSRVFEWMHST